MAIEPRRLTVGGPSRVSNTAVCVKGFAHIKARLGHQLPEFGHLAHLFECEDLILLVAVDCETGGVVTSVFKARET